MTRTEYTQARDHISQLTAAHHRAWQLQNMAAYWAAVAMAPKAWHQDRIIAQHWAAHYSARARALAA